ncbi:MFS transporter [Actinomadura nitritigenes]|uniref:MFS transporter n=1 Tax=Actinomadura nitritigenes TaxID=134602 RepID=UPI003D8EFFB3
MQHEQPTRTDTSPAVDRPWWTLIGPGLATIVGLFLVTAAYGTHRFSAPGIGTRLVPPMAPDLALSQGEFSSAVIVTYLVAAVLALPVGALLGGRYPTAVISPAIGLMILGALLVAFASGTGVLAAGRSLGGLGAGATVGATAVLVGRLRDRRWTVAAVLAGAGFLALLSGPFADQAVADAVNWRWTFLAAEPLLFAALAASTVAGIVLLATRRPARPAPYGAPYMPPPYPPPGPRP